jgi:predicted metal-dependent hydrolase
VQSASQQLPLFPAANDEPDQVSGFSVRVSARAKRLSIKVFPRGKVEVVVPRRTRPKEVRNFVEANREWIDNARRSFAAEHPPEPFALPDVIHLRTIDQVVRVRYRREKGAESVRYRMSGGVLTLSGQTDDDKLCVRALRRWLTTTARNEFEARLRALAILTEAPFKKLQIRCQRTCWGSRSSSGTNSINLCLLFLTPLLTRYLLIHELCHGRHMNHSKRFWQLVGRYEPDYRELDRQLGESWRQVPTWLGVY